MVLLFLNLFKKEKPKKSEKKDQPENTVTKKPNSPDNSAEQIAVRKGELGEYKIDIQLDQLPKDCRYLSDLMIKNPKAGSGYSQIDHVIITETIRRNPTALAVG